MSFFSSEEVKRESKEIVRRGSRSSSSSSAMSERVLLGERDCDLEDLSEVERESSKKEEDLAEVLLGGSERDIVGYVSLLLSRWRKDRNLDDCWQICREGGVYRKRSLLREDRKQQ